MLAIFDIQHAGKPGRKDLGAAHDIDGDGTIEAFEHEARLTPIYAAAASAILEQRGVETATFRAGTYSERHKHAGEIARAHDGPVAYVACHLNMGGGDYSLCVSDYRSGGGAKLSEAMAKALEEHLAPAGVARSLTGVTGSQARPSGRHGAAWDAMPKYQGAQHWPRPWSTVSGIYAGPGNLSGVCFEPVFMDSHAHLLCPDGLSMIGLALADGLFAYLASR